MKMSRFKSMMPAVYTTPVPMFAISDCHGVVIQHSVTWKTHVTGGGGGGFLVVNNGNGYGQVNPRWTRTDHVHRQDFWVRTAEGREINYWLEGFEEVAIRQGHELAVLVANGHVAQIINHTTRMRYRVATLGDLISQRSPMSYGKIAALSVFLMPVVGIVLWFVLVCIGFGIHDSRYGRAQPGSRWSDDVFAAWVLLMLALIVGAVIGGACLLYYRRRRVVIANRVVWAQGHEELAQACQERLGVPLLL